MTMDCPLRRWALVSGAMVLVASAAWPAEDATRAGAGEAWIEPMAAVRARFTGRPGTLAHFGDSITVSMAFWAPLAHLKGVPGSEAGRVLEKAGIYVGVNFVGLLDELVILGRPASAADVAWLHRRPGLLALPKE
jgi:hypothetical protein